MKPAATPLPTLSDLENGVAASTPDHLVGHVVPREYPPFGTIRAELFGEREAIGNV